MSYPAMTPIRGVARGVRHGEPEDGGGAALAAAEEDGGVATLVDRLYLYDNSIDDRPAQLLLRASEGTVVRQYGPIRPWMTPIVGEPSAPPPA